MSVPVWMMCVLVTAVSTLWALTAANAELVLSLIVSAGSVRVRALLYIMNYIYIQFPFSVLTVNSHEKYGVDTYY